MTIDDWNTLDRPEECSSMAEPGDIVAYIDDVFFLCQRKCEVNNIICFKDNKATDSLSHVKGMFKFCIMLYEDYNIEFVRVEGNTKRYRFLEKIFPLEIVVKDPDIQDRNVYYCNIRKANAKLRELAGE